MTWNSNLNSEIIDWCDFFLASPNSKMIIIMLVIRLFEKEEEKAKANSWKSLPKSSEGKKRFVYIETKIRVWRMNYNNFLPLVVYTYITWACSLLAFIWRLIFWRFPVLKKNKYRIKTTHKQSHRWIDTTTVFADEIHVFVNIILSLRCLGDLLWNVRDSKKPEVMAHSI